MTDFLVRMRGDHLAPEIQPGDVLTVREQTHAETGALAVVLGEDDEATVRRYDPEVHGQVVGVVTDMWRKIG